MTDYHETELAILTETLEMIVGQWIEAHEAVPVEIPDYSDRTLIVVPTGWNANNIHLEYWAQVRGADLS